VKLLNYPASYFNEHQRGAILMAAPHYRVPLQLKFVYYNFFDATGSGRMENAT